MEIIKTLNNRERYTGLLWKMLLSKKNIYRLVIGLLLLFVCTYIFQILLDNKFKIESVLEDFMWNEFLIYFLVGLAAQAIDGALGMAYGISSTSFLLSAGVSPAAASASVHIAEVFTSGASGLSHLKLGNVNKKLFRCLVIPGTLGAIAGAYLLSELDGSEIKPFVSAYLIIMGFTIIYKAIAKRVKKKRNAKIGRIALIGGFVDAIGGGGWGPVVTSTLISKGRNVRYTIGSVNLAEFFVAFASSITFVFMLGSNNWVIITGLMLGGLFAAPFAAYLVKRFEVKTLMIIVGILIIVLSTRTIIQSLS